MAGSPIGLLLVLTDAGVAGVYSTVIDTPGDIPIVGGTVTPVFVGSASTHSAARRPAGTSWNPNWNRKKREELEEIQDDLTEVSEEIQELEAEISAQRADIRAAEVADKASQKAIAADMARELKRLKAYEQTLLDDEEAVLLMLLTS